MRQWTRLLLLILSLALALSVPNIQAQDDTLKIGVLTDLSGELLLYGIDLENGFRLGLDYATGGTQEIAGRPVEILVRDYGDNAGSAAALARELIEGDGVEILVGAPSSTVTLDLIALAAEHNVILMAGSAADPRITGEFFKPTTFRVCHNATSDALAMAAWVVANVGTRYIQLAPDHAYGYGLVNAIEAGFTAKGASLAADPIYVPTETTDFTPYLQQVMDSGADGVIITWAGAGLIPLFQQANALGLGVAPDKPVIITSYNSNDVMLAFADPSQVGSIGPIVYHYTLPATEANAWLVEHHIADYATVPDLFTECGFASAQALVEGLTITGGDSSPTALIPALEGLSFEGPRGTYTIRPEDHQALFSSYIVRLVNLDDPDRKFYELLAEIPADAAAPPCLSPASRSSAALTCTGAESAPQ